MSDRSRYSRWLLRSSDQTAVAALALTALVAIAGWWLAHGGWRGNLVEIDRAEPLTARFEVDINAADWPELVQLPGVGRTLAQRIIESRQVAGPFAKENDLRRVRGMGPKTLERIRPYLRPLPGRPNTASK